MSNLIKKLKSVGIDTESYKRGPLGKAAFSLSRKGKKIMIWEGDADIDVKIDGRTNQALLTVREKPRHIYRWISTYLGRKDNLQETENIDVAVERMKEMTGMSNLRYMSDIQVPNSRCKASAFEYKIVRRTSLGYGVYEGVELRIKLKFSTRTTTTCFLIGFDEKDSTYPFICQLKNVVRSISDARKELIPQGVRLNKGFKRHGEWFLNPVSNSMNQELFENMNKAKAKCPLNYDGDNRVLNAYYRLSAPASTHRSTVLVHNKKSYAIGKVWDTRKGHHSDIILKQWYEIVRNNEVVHRQQNNRRAVWD